MALVRLITSNCRFLNKSSDISKAALCLLKPFSCSHLKQAGIHTGHDGENTIDPSKEEENGEHLIRETILSKALDHVPECGWSIESLIKGAKLAGYPGVAHGMFPQGGSELVEYFYIVRNEKHIVLLKDFSSGGMAKKEFIKNAVKSYLELIIPYINFWPQAMGIMSLPQNLPIALQNTMIFADNVWHYAGDKSTDINWYTKRVSVASIYKMSELCLIQDKSIDFEDTWQFLDRRVNNAYSISTVMQQLKGADAGLSNFIKGSIITARNIVGLH